MAQAENSEFFTDEDLREHVQTYRMFVRMFQWGTALMALLMIGLAVAFV